MQLNDFYMIVAHDEELGIGRDNDLPWQLSADLQMFKKITSDVPSKMGNNVVVMGRKTWDSIPEKYRPLPNRTNVVLSSRDLHRLPKDVIQVKSFDEALTVAGSTTFVIGGASLYEQGLDHPNCKGIYTTEVKDIFECDTYLPEYRSLYEEALVIKEDEENGLEYKITYHRKIENAE
jgi:dihydrofolate reductase